ncbi:response regulator [Oscillatoriales cyanobacterium LEGE 11467]|uniref:histidine kinase n=1 Tax=Zarconia navalis LEGE 11467 TaxID=1828826 RepID=A0A928VZ97_9CYAN|nr:response regulator [Zarconia navalis]MBE9042003.1 response regulator [Zarconia navalis LEGE 11467]
MTDEIIDRSTILIVDDNPTNLEVLSGVMADSGWEILVALDGQSAIEQIEYAQPDLVILDVMMPGIDGFETCYRIKSNADIKDTPIIFMTALSDTKDKVKGFSLGAIDYITKPFQTEEVLARVKTHLQIRELTRKLQDRNHQLVREVEERVSAQSALETLTKELEERVRSRTSELTRSERQLRQKTYELEESLNHLKQTQSQLVQAEKISSLGQLVAGIAHEVNNPVGFISGNLDYASEYLDNLLNLVNLYQDKIPNPPQEIEDEIEDIDLEFLLEDLPKLIQSMKVGTERIQEIMLSLRTFTRIDKEEKQRSNIQEGIESTLMILQHRLKANQERPAIQVVKEYENLPPVICYGGQLNQVFMNLLANAIDSFEESNRGLTFAQIEENPNVIRVKTQTIEDRVAIEISDNGTGIPEEVRQNIFGAFFTTKPVGKGTGLGLSISYQIVTEKHGGSLECRSEPGVGTTFRIEIPNPIET